MSDAPPKFVTIAGVRKLNPQFKIWKQQQGSAQPASANNSQPAIPQMKNEAASLAIVSNMEQMSQLEGAQATQGYQNAVNAYVANAANVGLTQQNAGDEVSQLLAKYEIPAGALSKMNLLSEMQELHFLNDDSGSMNARTDSKRADGSTMTRWEEMQLQQERMIEMLAYFVTPQQVIRIIWMNNPTVTTIQKQQGEAPAAFLQRALAEHKVAFSRGTMGLTPAMKVLKKSFSMSAGKPTARFYFGDGCPSDCDSDDIAKFIRTRANPRQNPFTLVACTNDDDAVAWFGDVDEAAEYCSASDDFNDESNEVLKDAGKALPYSYGLYLMALMVGALDPNGLDALDESAPIAKVTLDELLGYTMSDQEYNYYFQEFLNAQNAKRAVSKQDKIAKSYIGKWKVDEFRNATSSSAQVPAYAAYKKEMKESMSSGCVIA